MSSFPRSVPHPQSSSAFRRGIAIEENAVAFFESQPGYRLIERNYGAYTGRKKGEIDLIYLKERDGEGDEFTSGGRVRGQSSVRAPELVFVEVRSRVEGENWASAEESLSGEKLRALKRAIELFLWKEHAKLPRKLSAMRLDLLCWNGREWNWIQDVRF